MLQVINIIYFLVRTYCNESKSNRTILVLTRVQLSRRCTSIKFDLMGLNQHKRQSCLFRKSFRHHQHFTSTNGLSSWLNKFWSKQTNFQMHRGQNLSQVKNWWNRINKQNHDKLVNHLLYKLQQACDWTEINSLGRQKLSFAAKLRDSKILKQPRINPGSWRWNPLATMLAVPMNRSGANGIWRLWNF